MAGPKKYDPKDVVVVIGAIIINSGFAPDTFVEVERDEDAFSKSVGADGEITRVRNRNRCGQLRLTLQQSSSANALLSALAALDEASGDGVVPVAVKDLGGLSLAAAELGWVKKLPTQGYGKDLGTRQWIIDTGDLTIVDAGT